jgi:soluble lytic murein transglycosylase-like protein
MKSLGELFRRALDHHADRESAGGHVHAGDEESSYLLLGQKAGAAEKNTAPPTRQEVLNYFYKLAKDYHLPPKLVYAVADAESGVNP